MSEFTDELKRLDLAINLPSKTYFAIEENFKDWQPPMELVEAPKSFDKWYKEIIEKFGVFCKKFAIKNISQYGFGSFLEDAFGETVRDEELLTFANDYESFLSAIIYGYTVEKEQMFILKHIDISKLSTDDSLYLAHGMNKKLRHVTLSKDVDVHNIDQLHFTKSEVDELNVSSYEQIEVDE